MPVRKLGDRPSHVMDDDAALESEGYLLTSGADGDDNVAKTTAATDTFVGVSYRSTKELAGRDPELLYGEPTAVQQEGVVNVLCEEGSTYNFGEMVYVSDTVDGVATGTEATDAVTVGMVANTKDLSGADGPGLVHVNITGHVGE